MLTHKKRLYVDARLMGKNLTDSAIFAGCPADSAARSGNRWERDPDVQAHMARKQAGNVPGKYSRSDGKREVFQRNELSGNTPKAFMQALMLDDTQDPKLRLEAAKALLTAEVRIVTAQGKKEQAQVAAKQVVGRFAPSAPPLKVVQ